MSERSQSEKDGLALAFGLAMLRQISAPADSIVQIYPEEATAILKCIAEMEAEAKRLRAEVESLAAQNSALLSWQESAPRLAEAAERGRDALKQRLRDLILWQEQTSELRRLAEARRARAGRGGRAAAACA